jgi:hypothetical protein
MTMTADYVLDLSSSNAMMLTMLMLTMTIIRY